MHLESVLTVIFLNFLVYIFAECPLGWHHYESSCYLFSHDALDWFDAQRSCQGHYATLAEVEQQLEADYLINMAQFGPHVSYWLGGRDHAVEGKWQWSTNDQDFWYTAWAPGEPNGLYRENCLEMKVELNWQWNDGSCFTLDHYICEKGYDFQVVG